jgi:S-adenosylmethionine:tRNA ribosyltransferase-isomerase
VPSPLRNIGPFWSGPLDYRLPEALIAQNPASARASSRLMVLERANGTIHHRNFGDIVEKIAPGDVLIVNDSRVIPARLVGKRRSGGLVEALVLSASGRPCSAMLRSSKRLQSGEVLHFGDRFSAVVRGAVVAGRGYLDFGEVEIADVLDAIGEIPLPRYIRRDGPPSTADRERYQTVYAERDGSVAAPTAGLHFTSELLDRMRERRIEVERLTLHVGPGTFAPIRGDVGTHRMESEWCEVSPDLVSRVRRARDAGGRVFAVGTTTVRALETAAVGGQLRPFAGSTELFIRPGHNFAAIDGLLTNFHLPGSTLLCLVMAFAGTELTRRAYETAVAEEYRFYSYGDAMLVV